jgi:hypothetical protein
MAASDGPARLSVLERVLAPLASMGPISVISSESMRRDFEGGSIRGFMFVFVRRKSW